MDKSVIYADILDKIFLILFIIIFCVISYQSWVFWFVLPFSISLIFYYLYTSALKIVVAQNDLRIFKVLDRKTQIVDYSQIEYAKIYFPVSGRAVNVLSFCTKDQKKYKMTFSNSDNTFHSLNRLYMNLKRFNIEVIIDTSQESYIRKIKNYS